MKHVRLYTILSALLILHAASPAFAIQEPQFKHFSDYTDMTLTSSDPDSFRIHYVAKLRLNDRVADPAFEDNTWMLAMRRGLYLSEVEKAMSEIYLYFLNYSTDVDLIEEQGDYYVAGRKLKNLNIFFDTTRDTPGHLLIQKKQGQFYVGDYLLTQDGKLIAGNSIKQFHGLASLAVLTRFFGVSDAEDFNYGLQENETELRAIQFDNESGFSFDEGEDMENELAEELGSDFIQMPWYQNEKREMQEKIANTDFSIIEKIVRNNITVSQLDEGRWILNKILRDPTVLPNYSRKKAQRQLDKLNKMDESKYGVDSIIQTLKIRQQQLRKQLYPAMK